MLSSTFNSERSRLHSFPLLPVPVVGPISSLLLLVVKSRLSRLLMRLDSNCWSLISDILLFLVKGLPQKLPSITALLASRLLALGFSLSLSEKSNVSFYDFVCIDYNCFPVLKTFLEPSTILLTCHT